ncbi:hypothetical protein D2T30_06005 [Sinirhodobacter populi]|uniref:Uncharacterized protein n=1 Tax=Paenirhodobacter populi TaxID=2306993 RepID=A0A443JPT8_9RHOB|nr:hypothetical protein D2T30_06005 [Sinirhodobacter populi]
MTQTIETQTIETRTIDLPGVANLRDLGDLPSPGGMTRRGRLLRSDSLHRLDAAGQGRLRDLGLTTVIDLRAASGPPAPPTPSPRCRGSPITTSRSSRGSCRARRPRMSCRTCICGRWRRAARPSRRS